MWCDLSSVTDGLSWSFLFTTHVVFLKFVDQRWDISSHWTRCPNFCAKPCCTSSHENPLIHAVRQKLKQACLWTTLKNKSNNNIFIKINREFMTILLTYTNIHSVIANKTLLNTSIIVRTSHLAKIVRCETKLGCFSLLKFTIIYWIYL